MNYTHYGLLIFSLLSATASADEQRVALKFDALPESVRNTVSHFVDKDKISDIEKVSDGDHVKFEIKSNKIVDGKTFLNIDMTVAPDGDIMRIAQEAPIYKIPFPVMKQVKRLYPDLKVDEVEVVSTRHFLLQGKSEDQPVSLEIYDDGTVNELTKVKQAPKPAAQPAPEKTDKSTEQDEQLYQQNWSDDEGGLLNERLEGGFKTAPDEE